MSHCVFSHFPSFFSVKMDEVDALSNFERVEKSLEFGLRMRKMGNVQCVSIRLCQGVTKPRVQDQ